jgi:hypothetical protein
MSRLQRAISTLPDAEALKSIKFLQLAPKDLKVLQGNGVYVIKDLLNAVKFGFSNDVLSQEWLDYFECIASDGSVNWWGFYADEKRKYTCLYFQCDEFDELAIEYADYPVNKATFRKAGIALNNLGIETLLDLNQLLATGIDSVPRMGRLKVKELFDLVKKLIELPKNEVSDWFARALAGESAAVDQSKRKPSNLWVHEATDMLNDESLSLPLSALHMGAKVRLLEKAGMRNLGELLRNLKIGLPKIRGFGVIGLTRCIDVLDGIAHNINPDGSIDWLGFSSSVRIPVIPENIITQNGEHFLELIPSVISQLIDASADQTEKVILTERLTKPVARQPTLEELGDIAGVTRERIRQIEKALLTEISNGLLYDEYVTLEYRFRTDFAEFFRKAANAFMHQKEIVLESFIKTLSELWSVPQEDLFPHMPFITAIMTNKSMAPKSLRLDGAVPAILLGELPASIVEKPLVELPLGKYVNEYHKHGIHSLGEALAFAKTRRLPIGENRKARRLLNDIFGTTAKALKTYQQDKPFWLHYALESNVPIVPGKPVANASEYLEILKQSVREIIANNSTYKWSIDVYDMRTSQQKSMRQTMEHAGRNLGVPGPTIKRVETHFVSVLNEQLIEHDFSQSKVYIQDDFLRYWADVKNVYTDNRSFLGFKHELAKKWNVPASDLDDHTDLIWTIVHGYPHGRNVNTKRRKKRGKEAINSDIAVADNTRVSNLAAPQVIKLRGFKRVY